MVAAYYKKDLLNCWTSSSDISGYHAGFHEGHGTAGERHGGGMLCVNRPYGPHLITNVEVTLGLYFENALTLWVYWNLE